MNNLLTFLPGACFGFYDGEEKDCLGCEYKDECSYASACDNVKHYRQAMKNSKTTIDELIKNVWEDVGFYERKVNTNK